MTDTKVSRRIKEILKIINYTDEEIGQEIGVGISTIKNFKNGFTEPTLSFLDFLMSRQPNLNLNWLILGEGSMWQSIKSKTSEKMILEVIQNRNLELSKRNEKLEKLYEKLEQNFNALRNKVKEEIRHKSKIENELRSNHEELKYDLNLLADDLKKTVRVGSNKKLKYFKDSYSKGKKSKFLYDPIVDLYI